MSALAQIPTQINAHQTLPARGLFIAGEWREPRDGKYFDSINPTTETHLDQLEAILTDDVVIDHLYGLAQGKTAAMKMLRDVVPFQGIRHQATNPVCFVDGQGRPAVLSYLMVIQVDDASGKLDDLLPRVLAHALVTDIMRKENGRWRVAGRTFEQMRLSKDYAPDEAAWRTLEETAADRAQRRTASQAA